MGIMTHAKFHFNRLMLSLIFGIRASEPLGPGESLKRPGLRDMLVDSPGLGWAGLFKGRGFGGQ